MEYAWKFSDPRLFDIPSRKKESFPDIRDDHFWSLYERCSPFSMAHVTGFFNVYQSLQYLRHNDIPGDLIECGCHMGGMGIFIALLNRDWKLERHVFLFDTFEGFPEDQEDALVGHDAPIPGVRYPSFYQAVQDNLVFAMGHDHGVSLTRGLIEDTAPLHRAGPIALLRLDTDFYSSTKAELACFFPKLSSGGVLIVDDYGMFEGARRATDEYFATLTRPPMLNRIDNSVWSAIKP